MFSFRLGNKFIGVRHEVIVPVIMLIFVLMYAFSAYNLSKESLAFPGPFLIVLFITCIYSIAKCCILRTSVENCSALMSSKIVVFILSVGLFISTISYLGIYIAIPLFLVVSMLILGVRNYRLLIFVPVLITAMIHYLFVEFLKRPLSAGVLSEILQIY